jgi:hypothetical protein
MTGASDVRESIALHSVTAGWGASPHQPHARSSRKARTERRHARRGGWRWWCSGVGSARAALGMPMGSRRSVSLSAKAASVHAAGALRLRRHSNPTLTRVTSRMGVATAVAQRVSGLTFPSQLPAHRLQLSASEHAQASAPPVFRTLSAALTSNRRHTPDDRCAW